MTILNNNHQAQTWTKMDEDKESKRACGLSKNDKGHLCLEVQASFSMLSP